MGSGISHNTERAEAGVALALTILPDLEDALQGNAVFVVGADGEQPG